MGFRAGKLFVRTAVAVLPVLLFLAGVGFPQAANAATHPVTLRHSPGFCRADFNRDGVADRGSLSLQQGLTFIRLSLSGSTEQLSLHAGKAVLNVLALDVDRDGDTDLVALRTDLRLRVWLNNGHGEFIRRTQPELSISFGSKLIAGDSPQTRACCCSSRYDDDAGWADDPWTASIGPEPSEAHRCEFSEGPAADSFLAAIHPRGPPSMFRVTSN